MCVRLMHQLYVPPDGTSRNLGQKILSPQAQALLNGIFHAFVVSIGQIAFAGEPGWLLHHTRQRELRSQLESVGGERHAGGATNYSAQRGSD